MQNFSTSIDAVFCYIVQSFHSETYPSSWCRTVFFYVWNVFFLNIYVCGFPELSCLCNRKFFWTSQKNTSILSKFSEIFTLRKNRVLCEKSENDKIDWKPREFMPNICFVCLSSSREIPEGSVTGVSWKRMIGCDWGWRARLSSPGASDPFFRHLNSEFCPESWSGFEIDFSCWQSYPS